jgi:hypothetical protein
MRFFLPFVSRPIINAKAPLSRSFFSFSLSFVSLFAGDYRHFSLVLQQQ